MPLSLKQRHFWSLLLFRSSTGTLWPTAVWLWFPFSELQHGALKLLGRSVAPPGDQSGRKDPWVSCILWTTLSCLGPQQNPLFYKKCSLSFSLSFWVTSAWPVWCSLCRLFLLPYSLLQVVSPIWGDICMLSYPSDTATATVLKLLCFCRFCSLPEWAIRHCGKNIIECLLLCFDGTSALPIWL